MSSEESFFDKLKRWGRTILRYKLAILRSALFAASVITLGWGTIIFNSEQMKDNFIHSNQSYIFRITNVKGNSGGTGFLVKAPSGRPYVLTNGHVCSLKDESGRVYVRDAEGTVYYSLLIEVSKEHDLCLINTPIEGGGFTLAKNSVDGQRMYVLGHPQLEPQTLTKGNLAGVMPVTIATGFNVKVEECSGPGFELIDPGPLGQIFGIENVCLRTLEANPMTAVILPGNSGSPVIDQVGNIIGVVFAGNEAGTRGYIVPLSYVKKFLEGK
jgi:S1-C subfamily serine protease